jgi:hypothetical protein
MFIDPGFTKCHSTFGGAECFWTRTCLVGFRSSERRRRGLEPRAINISPLTGCKPPASFNPLGQLFLLSRNIKLSHDLHSVTQSSFL